MSSISTMLSLPSPTPLVLTTLGSVAVFSYWLVRSRGNPETPKLYHAGSDFTKHLIKHCVSLIEPFCPPLWAQNGHVQTLLGTMVRRDYVTFSRELVTMDDGGTVALDWVKEVQELKDTAPLFIVLPGLAGDAPGVSHTCKHALDHGYRPLVILKRGHGGTSLTTPKMQSFGDPSDLRQVLLLLRQRYQDVRIACHGISAGSGLLVSYLGEFGADAQIDVAVCVSPGYDAEDLFVNGMLSQPYDYLMMNNLKKLVRPHTQILSKAVDMNAVLSARRIADFDLHLYAKLYNHKTITEFWKHNNPMRAVTNIAIPILCISSMDDPVCRSELIAYDMFKQHPLCMLAVTTRGGHCGFLESRLSSWSDKVAVDYVTTTLEYLENNTL